MLLNSSIWAPAASFARPRTCCSSGRRGTGKSFLAQAIGYQAIKQGHVVFYRSIFDVVRDFLHDRSRAWTARTQGRMLNKYLKPDLLIVDDMGMKNLPKHSGEFLFEIIMRRYETHSTMMTSNRPLEDWGKLIGGDVPSAPRPSAERQAPGDPLPVQK